LNGPVEFKPRGGGKPRSWNTEAAPSHFETATCKVAIWLPKAGYDRLGKITTFVFINLASGIGVTTIILAQNYPSQAPNSSYPQQQQPSYNGQPRYGNSPLTASNPIMGSSHLP
jgi:hypothetical protein